MGMIEFLSRTLSQTFQVGGATGPQVKNNGGKLEVVDAAGSTTQAIVATPSANDHAANKAYVDGLVGDQGKVLEIAVPFDFNDAVAEGTGTVTSTAQLPNGAVVQSVDLKVLSNFDGGVWSGLRTVPRHGWRGAGTARGLRMKRAKMTLCR